MRIHASKLRAGPLVALVAVAALGAGTLAIGADNLKQWVNTEAGKSDAEKAKEFEQGRQAFQAKYEAWLADFVAQGRDPRKLQRVEMLATALDPQLDLSAAVAKASAIVAARVDSVEFLPSATSIVTLSVTQTAKGDSVKTIRILQAGGPAPDPNWGEDTLSFAESDPLLLPGDEAVLFLEGPDSDGIYSVQSFTGSYAIKDGRPRALEGNPFAGQVDALTVDAFLAEVEALAGR
ncbi:MAG: hypothetical protein HYX57_03320 [Chloroflexi bacterium]|nr:hypothetical protein [Chloroflexota bacterium]